MKKALIILLFAIGTPHFCQELPKIVPPSPEASSLAKFGEIPISHFTGLPNISIPFYTIEQDGVNIPISLSYHARGMKVAEIASRVGMGWALNYGGSLSRQTRGKPDEADFGFNEIRASIKAAMQPTGNNETGRRTLFSRYIDGYDFFPDKFMFNANGLSGSFTINYEDLQPLLKEYDDIVVSYSEDANDRIESFIITDSNGNKFYFGKSLDGRVAVNTDFTEISYIYKGLNAGGLSQHGGDTEAPFINSWQLMEIITANGSSIEFKYELEEFLHYRHSYDRYTPGAVGNNATGTININPVYGGYVSGNVLLSSPLYTSSNVSQLESYFSKIRTKQYHIKEIIFDLGKVKFIKGSNARQDLPNGGTYGAYPLDKIQITDNYDTIIKQFKFNYEYKTGTFDGNELYELSQYDLTATKRLFLSSIEEMDAAGTSNLPHVFSYNNQQIPNRFSTSQDLWGYYNGKPNGEFLTFFEYGSNTNDRTVDSLKSKVGMLEKITYPTGGSTSFIFEDNLAKPSIAYNQVVTAGVNPLIDRNEALSNLHYATHYNSATQAYEREFEIGNLFSGSGDGLDASVSIQVPNGYCGQNEINQLGCNFSITLTGNNGVPHQLYNGNNFINHSVLDEGTYTLKVVPQNHVHDHQNSNHAFTVTLNWREQKIDDSTLLYAGGKRISRIENRDSNDELLTFKAYDYTDPALGGTSGHLFGLPNFVTIHDVFDSVNSTTTFAPTGAAPGVPVSAMQGNAVGYEYVTEYYGDALTNTGKTEYTFMVTPDGGDYYLYPYNLPTDHSWIRGKNINVKHYEKDDNGYNIKREITNVYTYGGVRHTNLISDPDAYLQPSSYLREVENNIISSSQYAKNQDKYNYPLMVCHFLIGSIQDPDLYYKVYHLNGGTQDLMRTVQKDYYASGNLEKETIFYYDYGAHYQLKETEITDSDGQVFKTTNFYPPDRTNMTDMSTNAFAAAGTLENENRFHLLQTKVIKDGVLQSKLRNNFKDFNGITALETVQTLKGKDTILQDRIVYRDYDSKGNLLEVSKANGTAISYIWGYDQRYPVAKIENATYAAISSHVANLQAASFADNDRTRDVVNADGTITKIGKEGDLRELLSALRNAFPDAQVTSYTYDPLIGVTSITDPRGYTTYFDYDEFNRLKQVKDAEGHIISQNEYQYKN